MVSILKLGSGIFLKVLRMSRKELCLLLLVLVIGCQQAGVGVEEAVVAAEGAVAEAEVDKQLRINREALLKGSSEQTRIDAATVMLFSDNSQARSVILDVLGQAENKASRMAVCKALSLNRVAKERIGKKTDFLEPLLGILESRDAVEAKLAAEATLIFEYEQISGPLEKMVTDASLASRTRVNAVGALKLQPDKRAIVKLIELLGDSDKQVAAAAQEALVSLNIPVGKDARSRKQIKDGIEQMGREEFLRVWKIRQETQRRITELEKERDKWRELYLTALDGLYERIVDDGARGEFLGRHLDLSESGSEAAVRLWALTKVAEWWNGTNKSKFPAKGLMPILVKLISDEDRDVRLETVKLPRLLMGDPNSAGELLKQFRREDERDDEVKTQMFVTLGIACHNALLPDSGISISPAIRRETLKLAKKYLEEPDAEKTRKGAQVIKRLLEQEGLGVDEVAEYLDSLAKRCDNTDGALRVEILRVMAGLCAQSVYKARCAKRFRSYFEGGLDDKTDLVREAAVDGLIYIDEAQALTIFREGSKYKDSSVKVKEKIITLAGMVGGQKDLDWLAEKIGSNNESELAWQSMLKIFNRSGADTLMSWAKEFDPQNSRAKLAGDKLLDQQKVSFFEIAERKALSERKEEFLGDLLDIYLKWPKVDAAARLVSNCLSEKDLEQSNVIVRVIDNFLGTTQQTGDAEGVLAGVLAKIKAPNDRPNWQSHVRRWNGRLGENKQRKEPKTSEKS